MLPFSKAGGGPAAAPPKTRFSKTLRVVMLALCVLAVVGAGLAVVKWVALSAQQACLRAVVVDMTAVLEKHNLDHWWDFGTLLGLVRGGDIIYTEVDADISIPLSTRAVFYSTPGLLDDLRARAYTIEERDELKLRLYGRWGWFADMDVWQPAPNNTLFMSTGKLAADMSRYVVPAPLLVPTRLFSTLSGDAGGSSGSSDAEGGDSRGGARKRGAPSVAGETEHEHTDAAKRRTAGQAQQHGGSSPHPSTDAGHHQRSAHVIPTLSPSLPHDVRVPAQPVQYLDSWYGPTWRTPMLFEKGKDPSSDRIEIMVMKYAMWVFMVFLSFKCLLRIFINGLMSACALHFTVGNVCEIAILAAGVYALSRPWPHLPPRTLFFGTLATLFAAMFVPALTLAMGLSR